VAPAKGALLWTWGFSDGKVSNFGERKGATIF